MAIDNRHDFHAFSALRGSDFRAATLGHNEGRIDEAFFCIKATFVAKLVGDIRQHSTHNLVSAPRLKAPMHRFVVRIALREHVPLRSCVENPQDCFKHLPRRDWFASRTTIGNVLLRKMIPNAFPLFVREPNHSTCIAYPQRQASQRGAAVGTRRARRRYWRGARRCRALRSDWSRTGSAPVASPGM